MKIVAVGLGLIGGSMCKAIKKHTNHLVGGIDIDRKTVKMALSQNAIDYEAKDVSEADVTIVSLFPPTIISFIKENADLFKEGSDYVAAIKKDIFAQMKARMASDANLTYWMEDGAEFHVDYDALITRDGAFYIDKDGRLVVCFDEYDVAPGAMGAQSFPVRREAIAGLLR